MSGASVPALPDAPRGTRWGDLRLRVASAAVLAPLALACVWFGGWAFTLLVLVGFAGVVWEWADMCGRRPLPLALGVIYCVVALASLWLLRVRIGAAPVFFLLMVVWCSDIGAYAVGRVVGGPRLAPAISPGKTWSGAAGGLVAAMVGGVAVSGVSMRAAAAAMVLGIASQLGDLGESALKRHYRVKDSGRLIPGHGGLLDRLDGLMAAAVVVGAFLVFWLATGTDGMVRP